MSKEKTLPQFHVPHILATRLPERIPPTQDVSPQSSVFISRFLPSIQSLHQRSVYGHAETQLDEALCYAKVAGSNSDYVLGFF
jgi:hypothetical protein